MDVAGLLKALNDSIDFERELTEKYGGPLAAAPADSMGELEEEPPQQQQERSLSEEMRDKYHKRGQQAATPPTPGKRDGAAEAADAAARTAFRGIISSCFEPHLG